MFLGRLQKENQEGFAQAVDPGFQHALYTAQKEHARTGDDDLASLLVDLLVDRTRHPSRDIMQIVLDESLNTAPKLTEGQLAVLSVVFAFRYTQNSSINCIDSFAESFDRILKPFAALVKKNQAWCQHLEFTGCGAIALGQRRLAELLGMSYQVLFLKGIDLSDVESQGLARYIEKGLIIRCLNEPEKYQVGVLSKAGLEPAFVRWGGRWRTSLRSRRCSIRTK